MSFTWLEPQIVEPLNFMESEAELLIRRNAVAAEYAENHVVDSEATKQLAAQLKSLAPTIKYVGDQWWRVGGGQCSDAIELTRCEKSLLEISKRMQVRAGLIEAPESEAVTV